MALAALVGVGLCWAVTFHILGWTALGVEAGGSCGTRRGPCPQGVTPVLLLAFFFTFAGMFSGAAVWSRVPKKWGASATVLGVLVGIVPGWVTYQWLRGPHLEVAWSAPVDRPSSVRGMGTWVYGDLVVRVRTDRLTAYAAADGRVAWTVDAPGRTAVCTMSRDVVDGVGLVGWGADNERCTTVAAVDLRDGRVLWQRTRVAPQAATVVSDQVAVAQGVAVLVEESGLRAVGLRDNSERWQLPPQEECVAADVAAAPDQVTVLALCANQGVRVLAVDPATGRVRWQAGVPVEPPLSGVVLLRARPVVVHAVESGARGADDIITYSDEGRPLARIPRSGQDYDLALPSTALGGFDSWPARPDRKLVVTGDRLVVAAGEPRDLGPTLLVAYSLSTGQVQWRKTFDDGLVAVTEVDGEFVALDRRLVVHTTSGSTPVRGRHLVLYADLRAVGGAYVILAPDGTGEQPPAMGVR